MFLQATVVQRLGWSFSYPGIAENQPIDVRPTERTTWPMAGS